MHSSSCRRLCPHLQRHGAFRHAQAGQSVRHILVCVWLRASPWRGRHLDGCWLHCGCMAPAQPPPPGSAGNPSSSRAAPADMWLFAGDTILARVCILPYHQIVCKPLGVTHQPCKVLPQLKRVTLLGSGEESHLIGEGRPLMRQALADFAQVQDAQGVQLQQRVHVRQPDLQPVVAGEIEVGQLPGVAQHLRDRQKAVPLQVQHSQRAQVPAPRKLLQACAQHVRRKDDVHIVQPMQQPMAAGTSKVGELPDAAQHL